MELIAKLFIAVICFVFVFHVCRILVDWMIITVLGVKFNLRVEKDGGEVECFSIRVKSGEELVKKMDDCLSDPEGKEGL